MIFFQFLCTCSVYLMLYSLFLPSKANADETKNIDGKPSNSLFFLILCFGVLFGAG